MKKFKKKCLDDANVFEGEICFVVLSLCFIIQVYRGEEKKLKDGFDMYTKRFEITCA